MYGFGASIVPLVNGKASRPRWDEIEQNLKVKQATIAQLTLRTWVPHTWMERREEPSRMEFVSDLPTLMPQAPYSDRNSAGLFEANEDIPIQRHSGRGYTSITKNVAFKLRSVSTLGNYDYQTTYEFRMDGSMTISVRASGYIAGGYAAKNDEYGFNIHDNLSGSMHDHVITFKADLDVLGEKNSLQKVEFVPTTEM
jgi:hypothetical protein